MRTWIRLGFFVVIAIGITSCATTHPNEKLIVGNWKPVKAEQYFTEEELEEIEKIQSQSTQQRQASGTEKSQTTTGGATATTPTSATQTRGKEGNIGGGQNIQADLNRLIQAEGRAQMVIYPDHSAAKFYRGRTVKATWKLRGNGTVLVAKDLEKKDKYRIDILEISDSKMVVVENLPIGGIKITYKKVAESYRDER